MVIIRKIVHIKFEYIIVHVSHSHMWYTVHICIFRGYSKQLKNPISYHLSLRSTDY